MPIDKPTENKAIRLFRIPIETIPSLNVRIKILDKLEKLNSILPEYEYHIVSEIKQLCGGNKQDNCDLIHLLIDSDILIKNETDYKLYWSCAELHDNLIKEIKNSIK